MADAARHRLTVPSGADPLAAARKTVAAASSSSSRSAQYLSRLTDFRQMDIQSAMDQMKTLLSTRPHVVYKTSYYRKQTKNHWARDDPAFVALQFLFLVIACIAYSVSFRAPFSESVAFLLYSVLFNWLGCGCILASLGREIANRHLTDHKSTSHVRQSVEWLYAFDIHCNAFFPVFVLLCKYIIVFGIIEFGYPRESMNQHVFISWGFCHPFFCCRWSPIFPPTSSVGKVPVCLACQQYTICCKLCMVLVHHTFRVQSASLFIANGGFPLSRCSCGVDLRTQSYWLSVRTRMECFQNYGTYLL